MHLKIGHKIFGIASVILILMAVVAGYSIYLTAQISAELDRVANRHLPLVDDVVELDVQILEQDILLQRMLVLARDPMAHEDTLVLREEYKNLSAEIMNEFQIAQDTLLVEQRIMAATEEDIQSVVRLFDAIREEYQALQGLGADLVNARLVGDEDTYDAFLPTFLNHEQSLEQALSVVRDELEQMTDNAVIRAAAHERLMLKSNTMLTALAALLGLGIATIVTRALVHNVRRLVAGTDAVEAGDLTTVVPVKTKDEIGHLTTSFNHMVDELRMKERIKDTFGKYMDPRIVSNLLEHPEFTNPGGERREMTVMFIDLKGFTSISEALPPDDLITMINKFFGHMTEAISKNKGVVDKFMGDAVMAYWGPPFTNQNEHAELACRAASSALNHLEAFRTDVIAVVGDKAKDLDIDLHIGISTGPVVVGTVGSSASRSFTVMGDPVNLGSRLEGANKAYGTHIMLSERTRELAGAGFVTRELDLIRVKGKAQPTRVFELIVNDEISAAARDKFEGGLAAYRARNWDDANKAFQSVRTDFPNDAPSQVYAERVDHLRKIPPPDKWDGVWVFETK
jgi:adenylate cyclase